MKKSLKIFLSVAGVLALIGICFGCLSIYAKKEINKPKFELPENNEDLAVSELPEDRETAYDYVVRLFESADKADDVEGSWHTDVHLTEGEKVTPFSDNDNAVLSRILEHAQGGLSGLYPTGESVLMSKSENAPTLGFIKSDVTEFTAERGYKDEAGETVDDGNYYITLTVNPKCLDTKAMLDSQIRKSVEKELSSVLSVNKLEIEAEGFTANFRIKYATDQLEWVEIKHNFRIKASVDMNDDYKALSAETAEIELPYESVETIDFFHYGAYFFERQIAVEKSDMKALPLDVKVNAETTKDDYKLTFDISEDGILKIDEDGVMEAVGTQEEPVTVTATLEYDGHTYTDKLIVYATELEVKTDEPAGN